MCKTNTDLLCMIMEHTLSIGLHSCVSMCLMCAAVMSGIGYIAGEMTSAGTTPGNGMVTAAPPTPPMYDYYDDDYGFGYTVDVSLGSDYCNEKNRCAPDVVETYPVKNCYCDSLCVTMGDCCHGNAGGNDIEAPPRSQFTCRMIRKILTHYGVYVIGKCAEDWSDDVTKSLCDERTSADDILLQLPVSDNSTKVMFRNVYCAFCNYRYDVVYWRPQIECDVVTGEASQTLQDRDDCRIQFLPPDPTFTYRPCPIYSIINDCPNDNSTRIRNKCIDGDFLLVYYNQSIYRNEHCAVCNGLSHGDLLCEPPDEGVLFATPDPAARKAYSFRLLVDFNSVSGKLKDDNEYGSVDFSTRCHDDEIFDPFSNKCRKIVCIPPRTAVGGKCLAGDESFSVRNALFIPHANITHSNSGRNCTHVRIESGEFEFRNNTHIFIFSTRKLYDVPDYFISGSDVFICSEHIAVCETCSSDAMFKFDSAESYVSLVGLCLSIMGLFINLCVYVCFTQLRNAPGKILMCLMVALLFAQLLFLLSPLMENHGGACVVFAILVHYFFLAAFCWMNVVALDLWVTFSKQFISSVSNGRTQKRLRYYSIYGWLVPLAIVTVSVAIDSLKLEPHYQDIQPRYGNGVCWMTSRYGIIIFFACPLAVSKIFDCVAFVSTARHIYIANKHGEMARKQQNSCTFFINLKLSLVMGLTWVFAFVANMVGSPVLWYLFIIFNSLQGVFICVSFIFTRRVLRLLSSKLRHVSSYLTRTSTVEISTMSGKSDSNHGTQSTSLSSENKL